MTRKVDHFRFQDLPAEMRLMVYRYYFEPSEITFDEVGYTALPPSALTKTSTVISNECKALYLDAVRTFCKADNNIYIDTDDSEYMDGIEHRRGLWKFSDSRGAELISQTTLVSPEDGPRDTGTLQTRAMHWGKYLGFKPWVSCLGPVSDVKETYEASLPVLEELVFRLTDIPKEMRTRRIRLLWQLCLELGNEESQFNAHIDMMEPRAEMNEVREVMKHQPESRWQ